MTTVQQTVLVGLGALGRACLTQFKKRVKATYGDLPAFKLIVLDIGPAAAGEADDTPEMLDAAELIEIPQDELTDAGAAQAQAMFAWLPEKLTTLGDHWLQTRAASRATLHSHLGDIRNFLQVHIHELGLPDVRDRMTEHGFEWSTDLAEARFVLVSGLGDLVGSALILDIVQLMGELVRPNNLHLASTGIFFMPQIAPPAPQAEANAFASLKELNYYRAGHSLDIGEPGAAIQADSVPFNRGCYLIDTRNERGIALSSPTEAATLAGEWLYRTLLTPLGSQIDAFTTDTGVIFQATGQAPIYSSFGLATYVLPIEGLIEYSANRLSYDLITKQLLNYGPYGSVAQQVNDFSIKEHVRPESLMSDELRPAGSAQQTALQNPLIQSLQTVPVEEIMTRVAAVLNQLNRNVLPTLTTQIEANQTTVIASLPARIDKQVMSVLSDNPAAGLSLARQFLQSLAADTRHYADQMKRRELVLDARKKQQGDMLSSRLGPALSSATKSMPSYPIVLVAALAGLITPLAITSVWLNAGLAPVDPIASILIIVIVWLLALGGAVFAAVQTSRGIDEARGRYTTFLQDRFQTELQLLLVRAASKVYQPALLDAAHDQLAKLDVFTQKLQSLALKLYKHQTPQDLVGRYDFGLQRSVLTENDIQQRYAEFLGADGSAARLRPLIEKSGQIIQWRDLGPEQLEEMLTQYGREVFAPMSSLRVESFLEQQLALVGGMDKLVNELGAKAAPLLVYNAQSGQVSDSAARTYVGLVNNSDSDLKTQFQRASPDSYFEGTGDSHSLVVTSVRRGVPLSGLVRMQGFRQKYFEALQNNSVLHLADEMALLPDPITERPSGAMELGTAFALGLAFNFIHAREDGVYVVQGGQNTVLTKLTSDKITSALTLDDNQPIFQRLEASIHEHVSQMGNAEARQLLEAAATQPQLSGWERVRIQSYVNLLSA